MLPRPGFHLYVWIAIGIIVAPFAVIGLIFGSSENGDSNFLSAALEGATAEEMIVDLEAGQCIFPWSPNPVAFLRREKGVEATIVGDYDDSNTFSVAEITGSTAVIHAGVRRPYWDHGGARDPAGPPANLYCGARLVFRKSGPAYRLVDAQPR